MLAEYDLLVKALNDTYGNIFTSSVNVTEVLQFVQVRTPVVDLLKEREYMADM